MFEFVVYIPERYPYRPPKVQLITKIHHPIVDSEGFICLDILKEGWGRYYRYWSPVLTVPKSNVGISNPH